MIKFSKNAISNHQLHTWITIFSFLIAFFFASFAWYKGRTSEEYENHKENQANLLMVSAGNFFDKLNTFFWELEFLADNIQYNYINEVNSAEDIDDFTDEIEGLLQNFAHSQQDQYQIMYLDNSGHEIIRVQAVKNGESELIPATQLQDLSDLYFVKDVKNLSPEEVFISPFDFNKLNGVFENPLHPIIRIGKRLYDKSNNPFGMLIINYEGSVLFEFIRQYIDLIGSKSKYFILNSNGIYINGTPLNNETSFFMMDSSTPVNSFAKENPDIWATIQHQTQGQIEAEDGLYTYIRIQPSDLNSFDKMANHLHLKSTLVAHKGSSYTIINFLPKRAVISKVLERVQDSIWYIFSALAFMMLLIWLTLKFQKERQELFEETKYLATHDGLTGLKNRAYFDENLEWLVSKAEAESSTVSFYFVDLDGFKEINDEYGHHVGDIVLKSVSNRMVNAVRTHRNDDTDIIVRLGGDEFLVIVYGLESEQVQIEFGKKLLHLFDDAVAFDKTIIRVGASIGSASYRTHSNNVREAIRLADKMMYEVKIEGKNGFKICQNPPLHM